MTLTQISNGIGWGIKNAIKSLKISSVNSAESKEGVGITADHAENQRSNAEKKWTLLSQLEMAESQNKHVVEVKHFAWKKKAGVAWAVFFFLTAFGTVLALSNCVDTVIVLTIVAAHNFIIRENYRCDVRLSSVKPLCWGHSLVFLT